MALLFLAAALAGSAQVSASLVVKVSQPEAAADRLVTAASDAGGWFAERGDDRVVLRVPVDAVDGVLAAAAAEGLVADRAIERVDRGAELSDLRARIASRREVLDHYFALLPEADAESVLTVEREIVRVVGEVERLEGSLRVIEHDVTNARIDVAFRFRDRRAPTPDGSSVFAWLNTVDLVRVLGDFDGGWWAGGPRLPLAAPIPDGMSAYRGRRERKAVSPDGVVYRVRAVRHRPRAGLEFWAEALHTRMVDAGYVVVRQGPVDSATLGRGTLLEVSAPLGPEDATYAIAVFDRGSRLVLVEAAGEVSRYEARRDAVLEAVRAL